MKNEEVHNQVLMEYARNLSEEAAKQAVYFLLTDKDGSNKKSVLTAAKEFARMFGVNEDSLKEGKQ